MRYVLRLVQSSPWRTRATLSPPLILALFARSMQGSQHDAQHPFASAHQFMLPGVLARCYSAAVAAPPAHHRRPSLAGLDRVVPNAGLPFPFVRAVLCCTAPHRAAGRLPLPLPLPLPLAASWYARHASQRLWRGSAVAPLCSPLAASPRAWWNSLLPRYSAKLPRTAPRRTAASPRERSTRRWRARLCRSCTGGLCPRGRQPREEARDAEWRPHCGRTLSGMSLR